MSDLDVRPAAAFSAREVPLGGIRGVTVERLLPQRGLPTVGAWCFLDRFDSPHAGMRVPPHPHIGLQTVTWPLRGRIRHRDSLGSDVLLRPGQLNLMTAGRGIAHSEYSSGEESSLRAVQLWVALPADKARIDPAFERHLTLPRYERDGLRVTVFAGRFADAASPATVHSPLVGADVEVAAGALVRLPLRPDFEHALVLTEGALRAANTHVTAGPLLYLGAGRDELVVSTAGGARALLLGGEPFGDELVMWWNFVGRSHEEIAAARTAWQNRDRRFGNVAGHGGERIPAPELPRVRLRPRRRTC